MRRHIPDPGELPESLFNERRAAPLNWDGAAGGACSTMAPEGFNVGRHDCFRHFLSRLQLSDHDIDEIVEVFEYGGSSLNTLAAGREIVSALAEAALPRVGAEIQHSKPQHPTLSFSALVARRTFIITTPPEWRSG
jgi:hypothetical protein